MSLVFADCKAPPPEIGIILGEALYQQRSALDHLVWKLIKQNGEPPTNKSAFPIFKTWDRYKAGSGPMIKGISASARTRINSLQPFQRGISAEKDPLWMLHELNNTDKHRLIIVTQAVLWATGAQNMSVKLDADDIQKGHIQVSPHILPGTTVRIEDGLVLAVINTNNPEKEANIELSGSITFMETALPENKPIIPLLTQLSGYVGSILDAFEAEFR